MPLYSVTPAIPNIRRVQIDPDDDGDWLRVGSGPWHRVRIIPSDLTIRYALEVRLENGDIRVLAFDEFRPV